MRHCPLCKISITTYTHTHPRYLPFLRESYSEQNDAEGVSLEESPGEDGFDLRQRVAEDQGRFGQVPPAEPQRRQQEPHTERDRSMNELWCSSPMLLKNKNEWI